MKSQDLIINWGLDFPDIFGFWEMNELIIASVFFMIFILIQEVILGISLCLAALYLMHKLKDHSIRGRQDHFLWKIGFLTKKGFEYFPPASAVWFEE